MTESGKPAVWIGCLACYNAGRLQGDWFDLLEARDVIDSGELMVKLHNGPTSHEEAQVMDHEHMPTSDEFGPLGVVEFAGLYEEVGEADWFAFCEWRKHVSSDGDAESFRDSYVGVWRSFREYSDEFADDIYELDGQGATAYFDYEMFSRDLSMDHTVLSAPDGVFIFRD